MTIDTPGAEDPIDRVAHETAVLIRRAESARQRTQTMDRSGYLLLDAIAAHNPLALGSLAERFQLDLSTVSRQIAVLEAGGLVERGADPEDGRVSLLAITEKGVSTLEAARAERHALFADLMEDWSEEDRRVLGAALRRLNLAIARRDLRLRGHRDRVPQPTTAG